MHIEGILPSSGVSEHLIEGGKKQPSSLRVTAASRGRLNGLGPNEFLETDSLFADRYIRRGVEPVEARGNVISKVLSELRLKVLRQ